MVCVARRVSIRSTAPLSRALARRSFARCALRQAQGSGPASAALRRRPRHTRVGRVDRAGAGARRRVGGRDASPARASSRRPRSRMSRRRCRFDAGIVISASHNPFQDNGIKVFSGKGEKFTETLEREVEAIVARGDWAVPGFRARHASTARTSSTSTCRTPGSCCLTRSRSRGMTLTIDTANGATTTVAPQLFAELGFDLTRAERDAERPQHQSRVRVDASRSSCRAPCARTDRAMGVAFDGDGDRAIFVDAAGRDRRRRRRAADVRAAPEGHWPARRQRDRRDGDEQYRIGACAPRQRDRSCAAARSATST